MNLGIVTDGIILVNKEAGMTSFEVVQKIRRLLNVRKVGHLGTLDPIGEGLLPIAIGKACSLFESFLKKDKVYETVFEFGLETDTLDITGNILNRDEKIIEEADILAAIPKLIGKQNQIPPKFSAKHVNGKRAYELARAGVAFELNPKEIEIKSIQLLGKESQNVFKFRVSCSGGTYIRSLVRDLATYIGSYGIMHSIIRTKCGVFVLNDAFTLQDVANGSFKVLPIEIGLKGKIYD